MFKELHNNNNNKMGHLMTSSKKPCIFMMWVYIIIINYFILMNVYNGITMNPTFCNVKCLRHIKYYILVVIYKWFNN